MIGLHRNHTLPNLHSHVLRTRIDRRTFVGEISILWNFSSSVVPCLLLGSLVPPELAPSTCRIQSVMAVFTLNIPLRLYLWLGITLGSYPNLVKTKFVCLIYSIVTLLCLFVSLSLSFLCIVSLGLVLLIVVKRVFCNRSTQENRRTSKKHLDIYQKRENKIVFILVVIVSHTLFLSRFS